MPVIEYELWDVGDDRPGDPELVATDRDEAYNMYEQGGYAMREYPVYPVM